MLNELRSHEIQCPYCGEQLEILVDCSVPRQSYVEDCEICCRPLNLEVAVETTGEIMVRAFAEDD